MIINSVVTSGEQKPTLISSYVNNGNINNAYFKLNSDCEFAKPSQQHFACMKNGSQVIFNGNGSNSFIICAKIKFNSFASSAKMLFGDATGGGNYAPRIYIGSGNNAVSSDNWNASNTYFGVSVSSVSFSLNTWYYVVYKFANGTATIYVLANDYTVLNQGTPKTVSGGWFSNTRGAGFGGAAGASEWRATGIDFDMLECFILTDGLAVWGTENPSVTSAIS